MARVVSTVLCPAYTKCASCLISSRREADECHEGHGALMTTCPRRCTPLPPSTVSRTALRRQAYSTSLSHHPHIHPWSVPATFETSHKTHDSAVSPHSMDKTFIQQIAPTPPTLSSGAYQLLASLRPYPKVPLYLLTRSTRYPYRYRRCP